MPLKTTFIYLKLDVIDLKNVLGQTIIFPDWYMSAETLDNFEDG